jgi:hypothetical protein
MNFNRRVRFPGQAQKQSLITLSAVKLAYLAGWNDPFRARSFFIFYPALIQQ